MCGMIFRTCHTIVAKRDKMCRLLSLSYGKHIRLCKVNLPACSNRAESRNHVKSGSIIAVGAGVIRLGMMLMRN